MYYSLYAVDFENDNVKFTRLALKVNNVCKKIDAQWILPLCYYRCVYIIEINVSIKSNMPLHNLRTSMQLTWKMWSIILKKIKIGKRVLPLFFSSISSFSYVHHSPDWDKNKPFSTSLHPLATQFSKTPTEETTHSSVSSAGFLNIRRYALQCHHQITLNVFCDIIYYSLKEKFFSNNHVE